MSINRPLATSIAALSFTLPSLADAQGVNFSASVQDASGKSVSQLDNPVVTSTVEMLQGNSAESREDNPTYHTFAWHYGGFELDMHTVCSATDPDCVPISTPGEPYWSAAPSVAGSWDPGTQMPVVSHGIRIGHSPADIHLINYNVDARTQRDTVGTVSLDSQTILVPVNVVVVVPDPSISSEYYDYMQDWIAPTIYQSLFDDFRGLGVQQVSHPAGTRAAQSWFWYLEQDHEYTVNGMKLTMPGDTYYRPDDIFSQCGVQFRLASVTIYTEKNPVYVDWDTGVGDWSQNRYLCPGDGSALQRRGAVNTWKDRAIDKQLDTTTIYGQINTAALSLFLSPKLSNINCGGNSDFGIEVSGAAAISLMDSNDSFGSRSSLAHELGHIFGPIDITTVANCNWLMCQSSGGAHIQYCDTWRTDGVAPVNCVPDATDPPQTDPSNPSGGCFMMRSGAQLRQNQASQPAPMEPPSSGSPENWTTSAGSITYDTSLYTEGTASLQLNSSGYTTITSKPFRTADWFMVGNKLAVDVRLSSPQPNPSWFGSLDMFVTVAAANIYNSPLGHIELSGLALDSWHTLEFALSSAVQQAFLGDYPAGTITIAVNTPGDAPPVRLDNLRMSGSVQDRTILHVASTPGGSTNSLFSFDNVYDWNATNGTLSQNTSEFTQGSGSLSVSANGYTTITSRAFSSQILAGVTHDLSVDVLVPSQQPNPYWLGALQLFASCPEQGIYNQYIGEQDLTHLFVSEFNTVHFTLPSSVYDAFAGANHTCLVTLALNVNAGSGNWLLDNLAFR